MAVMALPEETIALIEQVADNLENCHYYLWGLNKNAPYVKITDWTLKKLSSVNKSLEKDGIPEEIVERVRKAVETSSTTASSENLRDRVLDVYYYVHDECLMHFPTIIDSFQYHKPNIVSTLRQIHDDLAIEAQNLYNAVNQNKSCLGITIPVMLTMQSAGKRLGHIAEMIREDLTTQKSGGATDNTTGPKWWSRGPAWLWKATKELYRITVEVVVDKLLSKREPFC